MRDEPCRPSGCIATLFDWDRVVGVKHPSSTKFLSAAATTVSQSSLPHESRTHPKMKSEKKIQSEKKTKKNLVQLQELLHLQQEPFVLQEFLSERIKGTQKAHYCRQSTNPPATAPTRTRGRCGRRRNVHHQPSDLRRLKLRSDVSRNVARRDLRHAAKRGAKGDIANSNPSKEASLPCKRNVLLLEAASKILEPSKAPPALCSLVLDMATHPAMFKNKRKALIVASSSPAPAISHRPVGLFQLFCEKQEVEKQDRHSNSAERHLSPPPKSAKGIEKGAAIEKGGFLLFYEKVMGSFREKSMSHKLAEDHIYLKDVSQKRRKVSPLKFFLRRKDASEGGGISQSDPSKTSTSDDVVCIGNLSPMKEDSSCNGEIELRQDCLPSGTPLVDDLWGINPSSNRRDDTAAVSDIEAKAATREEFVGSGLFSEAEEEEVSRVKNLSELLRQDSESAELAGAEDGSPLDVDVSEDESTSSKTSVPSMNHDHLNHDDYSVSHMQQQKPIHEELPQLALGGVKSAATLRLCDFSWWAEESSNEGCVSSPQNPKKVFEEAMDDDVEEKSDIITIEQQLSPVSVLDALFEEDPAISLEEEEEEEEEETSSMESSLANFEESKQQLLEKVRQYELLARLDWTVLQKYADEDEDEDGDEDEEDSSSSENSRSDEINDGEEGEVVIIEKRRCQYSKMQEGKISFQRSKKEANNELNPMFSWGAHDVVNQNSWLGKDIVVLSKEEEEEVGIEVEKALLRLLLQELVLEMLLQV